MEPIIGEIRPFAFNYPPQGWLYCDGRKLSIQQYTALYATIGVQYGGDQQTYFNLPNLQACVPNGFGPILYPNGSGGAVYPIAKTGGTATVALTENTMPAHNHVFNAATTTGFQTAATQIPAATSYLTNPEVKTGTTYNTASHEFEPPPQSQVLVNDLIPQAIGFTGGTNAHTNMMPYLAMHYCIAFDGVFAPRP